MDYLNMENSVRNTETEIFSQSRCNHCEGSHIYEKSFNKNRRYKGNKKSHFSSRNSNTTTNNKHTELNGWKPNTSFICVSEDHFIKNCSKPDTSEKKVHWNTTDTKNYGYISTKIDKTLDNNTDQNM